MGRARPAGLPDPLRSPGSGTGSLSPAPTPPPARQCPGEESFPTGHAQVSPLDRHWALQWPPWPHQSQEAGASWPARLPLWSDPNSGAPSSPACPGSAPQGRSRGCAGLPALPGLRSYRLSSLGVTQERPRTARSPLMKSTGPFTPGLSLSATGLAMPAHETQGGWGHLCRSQPARTRPGFWAGGGWGG